MYIGQLLKMNSNMTREEQRKARARENQARHLAKIKKEKEWLAANPHILAQQKREKEEERKNRETIRMLNTMKEEELAQKKKKKPVNAFAALMDSDDEDEEQPVSIKSVVLPTEQPKKFVWADECDD